MCVLSSKTNSGAIAGAGKTSNLKCSILFVCKRLRWRVLNSSKIMLTTSTPSEDDSGSTELSLKGKESLDLNANLIAAVTQHHGKVIAKTANTDTLLEVCPAGAELSRMHDAQSAPSRADTAFKPSALKISLRVYMVLHGSDSHEASTLCKSFFFSDRISN